LPEIRWMAYTAACQVPADCRGRSERVGSGAKS